jgi:hypothetical protein
MKRNIYLMVFTMFSIANLFAQTEFDNLQIIEYKESKNKIRFEVIDYSTNEPLIGAGIFNSEPKSLLAQTDVEGVAYIDKFITNSFIVEYVGYESVDFTLGAQNADCIVVRLFLLDFNGGSQGVPRKPIR